MKDFRLPDSVRFLLWTLAVLIVVIAFFYFLVVSPAESFFEQRDGVDTLGSYGELVGALLGVAVGFAGAWVAIQIAQSSLQTTKEQQRSEERTFITNWAKDVEMRRAAVEKSFLKLHALTSALWDEFIYQYKKLAGQSPYNEFKLSMFEESKIKKKLANSYSQTHHKEILMTLEELSENLRAALSEEVIINAMEKALNEEGRENTNLLNKALAIFSFQQKQKSEKLEFAELLGRSNKLIDDLLMRRWRLELTDTDTEEDKTADDKIIQVTKYFTELKCLCDGASEGSEGLKNWPNFLLMGYFAGTKCLSDISRQGGHEAERIINAHKRLNSRGTESESLYYNIGFFGLLILLVSFPEKSDLEGKLKELYLKDTGKKKFEDDVKSIAKREINNHSEQLNGLIKSFAAVASTYFSLVDKSNDVYSKSDKIQITCFDLSDPFTSSRHEEATSSRHEKDGKDYSKGSGGQEFKHAGGGLNEVQV